MTYNVEEVKRIIASMESQDQQSDQDQEERQTFQEPATTTIHIDYYPDAILITKEPSQQVQVVDSLPPPARTSNVPTATQLSKISLLPAYAICSLFLFIIISSIFFQLYTLLNPPIATVEIYPKSQQVTLTGTLQLGRVLPALTLSQSQTVPTSGRGHQSAQAASGKLIYFNGSFVSQTVSAGTVYTGNDGIQVETSTTVTIPAATPGNPPQFGYAFVYATAIQAGSKGNIPAGDINITGTNLQVSNTQFRNGLDQRDFQYVTRSDITNTSAPLKATLAQSIQGALQAQAKPNEQLSILPCTPNVTSDHQPGEEAIQVKVTVSLTCSAITYDPQALTLRATQLLTTNATKKLGTGYSLLNEVTVKTVQASVSSNTPHLVLSFHAQGVWVYGLSAKAQESIKSLIAGKAKDQALSILAGMSGIERAVIQWGDDSKLPKNSKYIHIILFVS